MSKILAVVLLVLPLTCREAGPALIAAPKAGSSLATTPASEPQPVSVPKQPSSGEGKIDTATSRCGIARDIKSDKLAHSNGMPIDANDLQTAESDIRLFCR